MGDEVSCDKPGPLVAGDSATNGLNNDHSRFKRFTKCYLRFPC